MERPSELLGAIDPIHVLSTLHLPIRQSERSMTFVCVDAGM